MPRLPLPNAMQEVRPVWWQEYSLPKVKKVQWVTSQVIPTCYLDQTERRRKRKGKKRKGKEKERKETKQPEDYISSRKQFQVLGGKFKPGLEPFTFLDKKPIRKQRYWRKLIILRFLRPWIPWQLFQPTPFPTPTLYSYWPPITYLDWHNFYFIQDFSPSLHIWILLITTTSANWNVYKAWLFFIALLFNIHSFINSQMYIKHCQISHLILPTTLWNKSTDIKTQFCPG